MALNDSVANRLGATPAIALGATVAMWAVAYPLLLPGLGLPAWVATPVFTACFLLAGWVGGRLAGFTFAQGARIGLFITAVDLLVLGGLFGGEEPDEIMAGAVGPVIGFAVLAIVLGGVGAMIGGRGDRGRGGRRGAGDANWTSALALIVAVATFMLMVAGGVVTSLEAGLAVPGWLTAFDYPLVLFPIEKMRADAGIYAEHAHRLFGLLVGLSTILLLVQVFRSRQMGWVKVLAVAVLFAVIVQGVAGGTRVTEASTALAIAHGIFAHVVLGAMMALFVGTWRSFRATPARPDEPGRTVAPLLVIALVVQLTLGAIFRHLNGDPEAPMGLVHGSLGGHILVAFGVMTLAIIAGSRAVHCGGPGMRGVGIGIHAAIAVQFLMGIVAVVMILTRKDDTAPPTLEVLVTATHHAIAAVLMGLSVMFATWARRP